MKLYKEVLVWIITIQAFCYSGTAYFEFYDGFHWPTCYNPAFQILRTLLSLNIVDESNWTK
jgi:hypothetical protein